MDFFLRVSLHDGVLIYDLLWPDSSCLERSFVILSRLRAPTVIKYLDQSNITNAYISGMQQDLNLNGNQLNL